MILENIIAAFGEIGNVTTLSLMLIGVAGGLIAGAIPGFTIAMAVVLTLPFTFGMPASRAWRPWSASWSAASRAGSWPAS